MRSMYEKLKRYCMEPRLDSIATWPALGLKMCGWACRPTRGWWTSLQSTAPWRRRMASRPLRSSWRAWMHHQAAERASMCAWGLALAAPHLPSTGALQASGSSGGATQDSWVCLSWRSFIFYSLIAGSMYKELLLLIWQCAYPGAAW